MRPTVPTVKITLDRERTLRFDFNALAAFEEKTGKSALSVDVWTSPNATTLRALLWSALLHEDPALSLTDLGALIHSGNMAEISAKIQEAAKSASPDPTEDPPEDGRKNVNLPAG